ncbi:hypothetical protein [Nocardioides stalactiti]|uniref:hypothetical protein n=1 Tax=Nocardioides stalactiti TaxID=2755356 RepID=UPI001C7FF4E0|nr:hypothetical protein [Nocardioides stalactiti]
MEGAREVVDARFLVLDLRGRDGLGPEQQSGQRTQVLAAGGVDGRDGTNGTIALGQEIVRQRRNQGGDVGR